MVGYAGESDGSEENCVMISKAGNTVFGHHAAGRSVRFATPVEVTKLEADPERSTGRFQHLQTFGDDLFADPVPRNYCNLIRFQRDNPLGKKSAHYSFQRI